jgi:hypothetical protein
MPKTALDPELVFDRFLGHTNVKNICEAALAEGNEAREIQKGWTNVKKLFAMKTAMGKA